MRKALNNLNSDLVRKYPDYVCRVVSEEGIWKGSSQPFSGAGNRIASDTYNLKAADYRRGHANL